MICKRPLLYYDNKIMGFNPKIAGLDSCLMLGCGKCLECKLSHSQEWAIKCDLESKRWKHNYFITLTYNEESVPKNEDGFLVLDKTDVQKMLKRIRKYFDKNNLGKIKYLYCGEYGPKTHRPHYHMILFTNYQFPDFKYHTSNEYGDSLYTSEIWNKFWPYGFSLIGSVSANAGAYVARYTVKKQGSKQVDGKLPKEFINMSLKDGGIGYNEFLKNKYWKTSGKLHYATNKKNDISIKNVSIPKYWLKKLERELPEDEVMYIRNLRKYNSKQNLREYLAKYTAKQVIDNLSTNLRDEKYKINYWLKNKI